ncbi:MAG: hypothetical protein COA86_11435 [Kangiella sp.]|nr:MAG: hypothetical protein COA86_11435 [Kangiella sp.]
MRNTKFFLLCFALPALFYIFWYVFQYYGWRRGSEMRINGFFVIATSYPWSTVAYKLTDFLDSIFNYSGRAFIDSLIVCTGFALNLTVAKILVNYITMKFKSRSHNQVLKKDAKNNNSAF